MGGGYQDNYDEVSEPGNNYSRQASALQIFSPTKFPTVQFPGNPYNTGPLIPFMPFSEGPAIMGFKIIATVGTVYGGFDSPPRNIDQPWSGQMSAAVKKAGIASLQEEASACGANGLVNLSFTLRESNLAGDKIVTHCESQALAVRLIPV